ncbi:Lsr2 family protein [Cellulomonas sp. PhB143]|uniref:histone-like nucleoid-structuring protein Lsr2 n=1 Tax=Cellulomonas sp. PhB143 TaxID=2485186 RepID=UPI000F480962|nr:Lsr2 family protein [Cellulomonas sp. PhB143]ROS78811.1 Lsr2 protein [Cellulomonas sp. PhB143]
MAQKVQVILIDDIDEAAADETVTFSLDGVSYEIDLSTEHAQELRDSFASWIGHARKVTRGARAPRPARAARRAGTPSKATEVREWARANGHEVSERGRISADVQKAYDDAH